MAKCFQLIKSKDSDTYTPESLDSLKNAIFNEFCKASLASRKGPDAVKLCLKEGFIFIGENIHQSLINTVINLINEVILERRLLGLVPLFPACGLHNILSTKYRKYYAETKTLEDYQETETTKEVIQTTKQQFLDDFLGNKAILKNKLKLEVSYSLLNAFVINRELGKIISDIGQANREVKLYKEQLFEIVKLWAIKNGYSSIDAQATLFDDKGNFNKVFEALKSATNILESKTPADLLVLASAEDNSTYKAATAWFTLSNFDSFLDLIMGDAIKVLPGYANSFRDGDRYYYSDKGDLVITSWRTTDNIVLEHEIGALALTIINTAPLYTYGVNMKSNQFLKFLDFYRMIISIKDLGHNETASSIIISSPKFDNIIGKYGDKVQNKSLRYLINLIRLSPMIYAPIVFDILCTGNTMKTLGFDEESRNKIYSIYKGFFDTTNTESLISIQSKYNYQSKNYYNLITQVMDSMFSVKFLQYYDNNGTIVVRTLDSLVADVVRKRLETAITGRNSRKLILDSYEEFHLIPYKGTPIINDVNKKILGIQFKIGNTIIKYDYNNDSIFIGDSIAKLTKDPMFKHFLEELLALEITDDLYTILVNNSNEEAVVKDLIHLTSKIYFKKYLSNVTLKGIKGKSATDLKLKAWLESTTIPEYNNDLGEIKLIDSLDVTKLDDLADAITILTGDAQATIVMDSEGNMLNLQTLSRLLGNIDHLHETIRQYFIPSMLATERNLLSYELLESTKKYKNINIEFVDSINTGLSYPVAISVNHGNNTISIVKDLLKQKFAEKAWTKPKQLLDGSFAEALPKDIFTTFEEFLTFTLEHEYQHTLFQRNSGNWSSNGSYETYINNMALIRMPKSSIIKPAAGHFSLLNSNLYCGNYTTKEIRQGINNKDVTKFTVSEFIQGNFLYDFVSGFVLVKNTSKKKLIGNGYIGLLPSVNSDKNTIGKILLNLNATCNLNIDSVKGLGINKSWRLLTIEELEQAIQLELGQYYTTQFQNVFTDFQVLREWLANNKNINIVIDPRNHFKELNDHCKSIGIPTHKWLFNVVNEYNQTHRNNPIQLIDLTHYIKAGNEIKFNNTTLALLRRYNDSDKLKEYLNVKRSEMLLDIITKGIEFDLTEDSKNTESPKHYLLTEEFKSWIGGTTIDGTVILNNKMTLAKLTYKGITYNIASKEDLIKFNNIFIKDNPRKNIFKNPHYLLGSGISMQLHPMLDKYNLMDFLFTLLFMLAGVGSHTNHPVRVPLDTPVIFNSVLDALNLPKLTFSEIDHNLVVYFNINDENLSDSQLLELWDSAKTQANRENKALITSSQRIKSLREKDFTGSILDINLVDTLKRTINYTLLNNEIKEEAARFLALHKRNVSYTAAMHEFLLDQIDGIPIKYNIAIIDDITAPVYTISGDRGEHAPLDGATFVNPWIVIWENNSLNGDRAGIDKKPFIHFYDPKTGTAVIIKTAGFGLTNDRIRNYKFYRDMMKNMTDHIWKNEDGKDHIVKNNGILEDFEGNHIDYGPIYYKLGSRYYKREILKYEGDNKYKVTDTQVDIYGDELLDATPDTHTIEDINSNYKLWLMFGGYNSMELKGGKLQFSEKSIELVARAANNYGVLKPGVLGHAQTASLIYLPMKHSDIHYMPTVGAIKQGMANCNPKEFYYGEHKLNFMTLDIVLGGILLDKEHHADNADVSLMTLVISAACANGYSEQYAKKLYTALKTLTVVATLEFREQLGGSLTGDINKFNKAITNIILKQLLNSKATDGDLVHAIAQNLLKEMRTSKNFKLDEAFLNRALQVIPGSDPAVYPKIVNMITVALTKSGIKARMPGILAVLCPSHEIIKFYKVPILDKDKLPTGKFKRVTLSQLEEYCADTYDSGIEGLWDSLQEDEPIIGNVADIEIGYKYLITKLDGTQEVVHVNRIAGPARNYKTIQFGDDESNTILEYEISYLELKKLEGITILEWLRDGLDLKSYNVRFEGEDNVKYQIADLDIVRDYFDLKDSKSLDEIIDKGFKFLAYYGKWDEFITRITNDIVRDPLTSVLKPFIDALKTKSIEMFNMVCTVNGNPQHDSYIPIFKSYILKRLMHFMNNEMQLALNAISPSNNDTVTVLINNAPVSVKKDTIKILNYGLIMPKTFKSNLGLEDFDDVETIKNDTTFFTKRLAAKFATKVDAYKDYTGKVHNNYHLELKRTDGNHIYIRLGIVDSDLTHEVDWFKRTDENGNVFRVDGNNRIIYQMFSADDKIYKDSEGNEIIVTSYPSKIYRDASGKILAGQLDIKDINGVLIDQNTGNLVFEEEINPIQFYLNTMNYHSFNISPLCSDVEFTDLLNYASNSTNKHVSKLADNIKNYGKGSEEAKLVAQRLLVARLNDYTKLVNETDEGANLAIKHLLEIGRDMHTSFLRSLHVIAARIPAQNQQSFMGLEIAAYENMDVNSAMVSLFLFYLLGSDLDIDAVSLQTFELDRNGLYVGHSPYYSLQDETFRGISDNLPFPTGIELIDVPVNPNSTIREEAISSLRYLVSYIGFQNKFNQESLFNLDIKKDGSVQVILNTNSAENLEALKNILEYFNTYGFRITEDEESELLNFCRAMLSKNEDVPLSTKIVSSIISQIKKHIDRHNLYLNKVSLRKKESIVKNYVTMLLLNIISDPVNRRLADSSVDVVTIPAKLLAKTSPKATVLFTFTPGNVVNKFDSIFENMVGKDGIAICATGLKSFFALTEMYSEILNLDSNDTNEKERLKYLKDSLLFNVQFCGKEYHGLANGFSKNFKIPKNGEDISEEVFSRKVLDYLVDQFWQSDAANEMSAMLGLSVDNAKELVLAKINAGTATMGMYLYGLAIGIPFDLLYQVINSPLVNRLVELTGGNLFDGDVGTFNIKGSLLYLSTDPDLYKFHMDMNKLSFPNPAEKLHELLIGILSKNFAPEKVQEFAAKGKLFRVFFNFKGKNLNEVITTLERLRKSTLEEITPILDEKLRQEYIVKYNLLIDYTILYFRDIDLLVNSPAINNVYGSFNVYDAVETLVTGAEEFKLLGKMLRINLEIKTNVVDLIAQIDNIEECIERRLKQIDAQARRKGDKSKVKLKELGAGKYRIDFNKFMEDSIYAQQMIEEYDRYKQSFNPLRVLKTVPHYSGYLESMYIAYKGILQKLAKFNVTQEVSRNFIKKYKIADSKLKELVIKNTQTAFDILVRRDWMKGKIKPMTLPADGKTRAFIDGGESARILKAPTEILLGTPIGDANYKLWLETLLIPYWKKLFPNNKFLQMLKPVITKTSLGIYSVSYGLHINMLPRTEYERDVFNEVKEDFNKLISENLFTDAAGNSWAILDMLYIYSLITTNGKIGPNSMHGIFEDYVSRPADSQSLETDYLKEINLPRSFRLFLSSIDLSLDKQSNYKLAITEDMIAPIGNPNLMTNILKIVDSATDKVSIYVREPKYDLDNDDQNPDSMYYDPEMEYYMQEQQMYEFLNNTSSIENYLTSKGFKKLTNVSLNSSLNTNYFTYAHSVSDLKFLSYKEVIELPSENYPSLSKYRITVQPTVITNKRSKNLEIKYTFDTIVLREGEIDPELLKKLSDVLKVIPCTYVYTDNGFVTTPDLNTIEFMITNVENNC